MVPRGPIMGCHVAPLHWLVWKICMDSTGGEPMPFGLGGALWQGQDTSPPMVVLIPYSLNIIFECEWLFIE
jgi:hypothetical protein